MATETKTKIPSDCHLEGAGCSAPSLSHLALEKAAGQEAVWRWMV